MSAVIVETPNVVAMAETISHGSLQRTSTLVQIERGGDGLPIYWVPGGGGLSVLMFRDISRRLGGRRPIFGFEMHARLEDAPEDIPQMAGRYVQDLLAHDPRGPYLIFGFSFGGWTAFEMVRQLEARGARVALLGIFDTQIPKQLNAAGRLRAAAHRGAYHVRKMVALPAAELAPYARELGLVASTRLRRHLAALGVDVPKAEDGHGEAAEVFRELDRRNRAMTIAYSEQPHEPVQADIALFLAQRTSQSALPPDLDGRYGWRAMTRGRLDAIPVEGSHLSMLRPPDVDGFAATLERVLATVAQRALPA
jgi:thioesterase domain-containing protein